MLARGGSVSGNGGNAEISAGDSVGYYGYTDLSAANGETGTLLIDPEHLTISDAPYSMDWDAFWSAGLDGVVNINDQALANTLHTANVNLWATETLSTGSDVDVGEYDYDVTLMVGWNHACVFGHCFPTTPIFETFNYRGITANTLTVAAPEVNLVHDITLGNGALNVADILTTDSVMGFGFVNPPHDIVVDHLNLDGRVYKKAGLGHASFTTLADDAQINTTAETINVLSDDASIQQALQFADASDDDAETVNVAADTYTEDLLIDRAVKLAGAEGATLQTAGGADALITVTADDVNIDPFVFDGLGTALYGLYADGADGLVVDGNTFQNFTSRGVYVLNSDDLTVNGNTINNITGHGIEVFDGDNIDVTNNMLTGISFNGIVVRDGASDITITGNEFHGTYANSVGIYAGSVDGILIDDNQLYDGDHGIYVRDSNNITIGNGALAGTEGNTVDNFRYYGIYVMNSTGTTAIDANDVSNAVWVSQLILLKVCQ